MSTQWQWLNPQLNHVKHHHTDSVEFCNSLLVWEYLDSDILLNWLRITCKHYFAPEQWQLKSTKFSPENTRVIAHNKCKSHNKLVESKYLCGCTKSISKVYSHHASCLLVNHEVGQMPVSNPEYPVADAHQCVRAGKVGAQGQEGLGRCAHLHKGSP